MGIVTPNTNITANPKPKAVVYFLRDTAKIRTHAQEVGKDHIVYEDGANAYTNKIFHALYIIY
jgi:hypothetical protein